MPTQRLGEVLIEAGAITAEQLEEALLVQREKQGGALGQILVGLGFIGEHDLLNALGKQMGMETVDLEKVSIPAEVIEQVSVSIANVYRVVPISFEGNVLTVAMADPLNVNILDDLRFMLDCQVHGAVSDEEAVSNAIDKYYAGQTESVEDLIAEIDDSKLIEVQELDDREEIIDLKSIEEMAQSRPVRKLLNLVLLQAIKDQASDIHFEPFENEFKIRYRIDGVLYEMLPPPRHLALALTSRIKVMSGLNIAERRLPQDGRIELNIGGNPVDLRISTLPTMHGESVVMRVLDRSVVSLDLERLGLREDDLNIFRGLLTKPNGIIILTGPTGCGKTTTLYSALNEINDIGVKIITTEDPVEYDLDGIIQVEINESVGRSFAACLRSILRQDPDKILVGEVRDLETAQIAVQASLTGHIVFTTLHTNDAPTAITRLVDMGVEPFLIAATLEAVIAQRLVRRICSGCKEEYAPSQDALLELSLSPDDVQGKIFHYGRGCDACNNTGYKGRMALYEFLMIDDGIRDLIVAQESAIVVRDAARKRGMRLLRDGGLLAIYDGTTTIEEVVRETILTT
jgi:type IV pilus assembly protein PilB